LFNQFPAFCPSFMDDDAAADLEALQEMCAGMVEHMFSPEVLDALEAAGTPPRPRRGYGGNPRTRPEGGSLWQRLFCRCTTTEFREKFRLERPLFDVIADAIRKDVECNRYGSRARESRLHIDASLSR
jgi:hypothetical protein